MESLKNFIREKKIKNIFYFWWLIPLILSIYLKVSDILFQPKNEFDNYSILFFDDFYFIFFGLSISYICLLVIYIKVIHYYNAKKNKILKYQNMFEKSISIILIIISILILYLLF